MFLNKINLKLISCILVMFLLLPSILILSSPLAFAADTESDETTQSWLRGILMVLVSFLVNNFIDNTENNQKPDEITNKKLGDRPLIDRKNNNEKSEVLGFYVNWLTNYANSLDTLRENQQTLDMVAPFWYTLNPDGNIEERYGGHQYEISSTIKNRDIKVLPLINNNQKNNMILVDPETRKKAVQSVVELVKKYDYNGINIDFEFIPAWTRQGYTSFIRELSQKLPKEKLLTISVFPKIDIPINLQGAYDYAALAPYIDRMIIMTYDNHWSSGPAGPIAPIDWVEENIKYALEYISADKIMMGIANYGYDWAGGNGKDLSAKGANKLAEEKGVDIQWHKKYQTPYFNYQDNGVKHEVWFENSHSTAFKLDLVQKYNLQGIAIWRLGNGTKDLWNLINKKLK
jgi:spore germination protein YaaH